MRTMVRPPLSDSCKQALEVAVRPVQRPAQPPSIILARYRQKEEEAREREIIRRNVFEQAVKKNTTPEFAAIILRVWKNVSGRAKGVTKAPLLDLMDDGVMLTWDKREHHLDIEVYPNGAIEIFYKNRGTGEFWNLDQESRSIIPEFVMRRFDALRVD